MYLMKRIYQQIGNEAEVQYLSFPMRSFFDQQQKATDIEMVLDALNVIDNERNRDILNAVDVQTVNISRERQKLLRELMRRTDAGNQGKLQHVTRGTYNKTLLREKLFAAQVNTSCVLRQLTLWMNMSWTARADTHC